MGHVTFDIVLFGNSLPVSMSADVGGHRPPLQFTDRPSLISVNYNSVSGMTPTLEAKLKSIPPGPGVYLYKDSSGDTIYVGKAKSLRNRVRTYFQVSADFDVRKDQMMFAIEDVEFIVTDTEGEALALENNLIKQHKPKYNILLRDDKTYPYIKLTINESFPRAVITRRVRKDAAAYFGPFFPAGLARKKLKLIEPYFLHPNLQLHIYN